MTERASISAKFVGTPWGGDFDNPWPSGQPLPGERASIFAFEVRRVDSQAVDMRSYHVAPVRFATTDPVAPSRTDPQGDTVQWLGCGLGTVIGVDAATCQVAPDDPQWA